MIIPNLTQSKASWENLNTKKVPRFEKLETTDPHYEVLPHAPYSQDLIPSEFFDDFFSAEFWLLDIIEEYVMDDISYNGSQASK